MSRAQILTDSQLITLASSKVKLEKRLRGEIQIEIEKRGLKIEKQLTDSEPEGLSFEAKFIFLLPLATIIPMAVAANYLGKGETRKYKQAWRIMMGTIIVIFTGALILTSIIFDR